MTTAARVAYRSLMRTASEAPARPDRGLFGIVPPGRPTDVAVAALVAVAQLGLTTLAAHRQPDRQALDLLAYLLLAAGPVALLWRRRSPAVVLAAVMASSVLYFALGYPYGPAWLALIVAFWTAVTGGARRFAWATAVVGLAAYFTLAALLDRVAPATAATIAAHLGWLLLVLSVSEVALAARQRRQAAERTRAEEARRRAGEERMRIARELHDVLAHNISLINVQAGVALHLMDEQPGQSRTALVAIKQASNDALGELRSVLDVLRQGDEAPPRAPGLRPGPAGQPGRRGRRDRPGGAHPGRGAAPAPAGRDRPGRLPDRPGVADQRDPPRRPGQRHRARPLRPRRPDRAGRRRRPRPGGRHRPNGNGIRGMRERVAALGGELTTGPRPGGGFRVQARLPLDEDGAP